MNNKNKIVLVISIIGLIITLTTASYAYLKTNKTQEGTNRITALTCLDVSYESLSDAIELENAYPISDAEGINSKPYKFKIKNNCEDPVSVEINIETLKETTLDLKYVKVSLDKDIPALLSSKGNGTKLLANTVSTGSKKITTVILSQNEEREYDLRLWLDESTTMEQMGKIYEGKVTTIASPIIYTPIDKPDWNAQEGTLLHALKTGKYIYSEPLTTPGQAVSLESEGVISSTLDDYGTSYYFRGNIDDNYVVFANMCWRIVRITGSDKETGEYNNAIKLVLYNYNPNSVTNPCNPLQNKQLNAFARYDGINYVSSFNSNNNSNAYVGFMYGNPNGTTYDETHENLHDSTILTNLKKWYDTKLRNYNDNYLADTIWCNDKRLITDINYNPENFNSLKDTGISKDNTLYASYKRLKENTPSLKCGETPEDNKISKFTSSDIKYGNGKLHGINGNGELEYKVGLITSDEILYLGIGNSFIYENVNLQDPTSNWHTMTPYHYIGNLGAYIGRVNWNKGLSSYHVSNSNHSLRPLISLQSTVKINTGSDGTAKNPYIILDNN